MTIDKETLRLAIEIARELSGGNTIFRARTASPEKAVLVTTVHRGVFFGYATDVDGDVITLRNARNCLSWSSDVKGFLGLCTTGPSPACRIGPAAESLQVRNVTAVGAVSDAAVRAWEAAPWGVM